MRQCAYDDCQKALEPDQEKYCSQEHQRLANLTARHMVVPKKIGTGRPMKGPKPRKL